MTEYSAAEPLKVTMYRDDTGADHASRSNAIEANFYKDLREAADKVANAAGTQNYGNIIKVFVKTYPDLVKILLGQRDMT